MEGRPPRVIHVAPYYPPHLGGMETVAREIAERTARAGVEVSVLTSAIPRHASTAPGTPPVHRCAAIEIAHTPVMPGLLSRLLGAPAGALFHLHVAQPLTPELVHLASWVRGIPYLAHLHLDVGRSGPLGFLLPAYKRLFLARVLRGAARVIVNTPDDAALVSERYGVPPLGIAVIPPGVQLPPPEEKRPPPGETVLFAGRLSRQKNIPLLLEAMRLLRQRGRTTRLRIAGEGEEERRLRQLARRLGLEARVSFAGRLEGEALAGEFRAASVLALPSERESFGLVLVEAMAHGLPVVATDIPGVRRVVDPGRTGLLAPPDPESFAGALERVLTDGELRKTIAGEGRKRAGEFDWGRIIPRYLELYRQTREEKTPRGSQSAASG